MSDRPSTESGASEPSKASKTSEASAPPADGSPTPQSQSSPSPPSEQAAPAAPLPPAPQPGPYAAQGAQPPATPAHLHAQRQRAQGAQQTWQPGRPWQPPVSRPGATAKLRPAAPPLIRPAVLWSALATAVLSALLLGDGLGVNLLIVAVPAALAAAFAARAAGRRLRPWTATWAVGGLALLAVPALRDAGWPTFLAVVSAFALGSLALHGSRSWLGVLIGSVGTLDSIGSGIRWGWHGVRERADDSRGRWGTAVRTTAVALGLLVVFGTLFASADANFADLLGRLTPDVTIVDGPLRTFLFLVGLVGALAAARTAAAPVRWDGLTVKAGKPRGRTEWALPLIVLDLLFAAFVTLQLVVLLGGYDKVHEETGLNHADYARQGFWQLLWATLLTLLVIALALRWAPRGGSRDRTLVRAVLGPLCVLTLVVVASALRRMDLYVAEYGLTRLRISVAAMELWLGVVIVLILAAGVFGARLLPRAIAVSAGAAVLAFGLISPDAVVAEQNVQRFEVRKSIDLDYLKDLSADAVPALDKLPEPQRSCALRVIQRELDGADSPWYATSWGEARAAEILRERPATTERRSCYALGTDGVREGERDGHEQGHDDYDPY
ncbi:MULTISPECIES: DUF4153 domain-containing protein [unclassified Streptomyces]|uniref:DUF4153 domain-containing protein n=1 Tax=unclassified Streptomyces TaxID=2593676 RepID=UPI00081E8BCE|nr:MULTISPECIES: DUF4173 domain-containing protein [unclassified Streptomyces]MYR96092.1 DUF4173 domain-containing protein [Streptomyces sp. SID4937]SCE02884.1 protein of unknown function [Streptomyces sp. ScaeMP-e83]